MAVTASLVKELREKSGAGMMECKKALSETDGNLEEAMEYLRKNGQAKAEKKASRIAAEGLCYVASNGDKEAAVVEVNCTNKIVFIIFPPNINLSNKIPTSTFAEVGIYRSFLSIQ